jgi:putative transposase
VLGETAAVPRLPRLFLPGTPQHVVQRGNDRRSVFLDRSDYRLYLDTLEYAARRHAVQLHAYVLMTNHVHLLATPATPTSLPRTMQTLGRIYVRHFNRSYGRTGTLWEARYRSTLVDSDAYLLACMRYIELNPVRAGMVDAPADYPWSSHGANARGVPDPLVTPHMLYSGLAVGRAARQSAYRLLFASGLPAETTDEIRDATHHGWALGSEPFHASVSANARRSRRAPLGRPTIGKVDSDPT